jgi:hypothetical protein
MPGKKGYGKKPGAKKPKPNSYYTKKGMGKKPKK